MRSVPAGSFERLAAVGSLWRAWRRFRRGKRARLAVARFDLDADLLLWELHCALRDGSWRPRHYRLQVIRDPKVRLIAAAPITDRVVHEALLHEISPHYARSFVPQSYSFPAGRGPHRAVLAFLRKQRRFRYRLSLDIRRFFPSIRHDVLLDLYARRLRPSDARTLGLLDRLVRSGGEVYRHPLAVEALGLATDPVAPGAGLPIGSYLSHFSGDLYLSALDAHVLRVMKPGGYLRYMDDFTLWGDDRARLEEARAELGEWLWGHRRLLLNPKRWDVVDCRQPAEYLGYRIGRGGVQWSRKGRRRMAAKVREAAARGPEALERTLVAYRGLALF